MKLSIIIPVYNVEKYIKKCLLSCLKQDISHKNYEIIVVNDGSPDGSLQIAENVAAQADNVKIITQPNGGLSVARNTGLQHAIGDYVWFVDSDDCIRENCLSYLIEKCKYDKLDMLAVGAADIIDGQEFCRFVYPYKDVVTGMEILKGGHMQHCVPFTIYRREFLLEHNLKFYSGIYHEDSEFSPRAYFYAERVGLTNEIVYLVTINPNSITRTINYKKSFDCLKVASSIHEFQKSVVNDDNVIFYHNHISLIINSAMANFVVPVNNNKKKLDALRLFSEELYKNRHLFMHLRKSSTLKYKIEGFLFTLFPSYAMKIYQILQYFKQ